MKNLIDIKDLSIEEIDELVKVAQDIIKNKDKYSEMCKNKILATLFFEPSTRTRLSFESAMLSLGGKVIGFSEQASSSTSKGETLSDTIKVVSYYSDIIAMRHPKEGAPVVAAEVSIVPIINAGDGGHCHPTQTLTDLLTIKAEKGRFSDLTIGLCGDLKYGRTVHSLISAMSRYKNVKFVLISPKELEIPEYIKKEVLNKNRIEWYETQSMEEYMDKLDILYMTRVQKERFESEEEYLKLKDCYILNEEKLKNAKKDLGIMHPLPRVNEIAKEIDKDERACYFKQVEYGRYIRMALILKLLEVKEKEKNKNVIEENGQILNNKIKCKNPRCITHTERDIKKVFELKDKEKNIYRCKYCETQAEIL